MENKTHQRQERELLLSLLERISQQEQFPRHQTELAHPYRRMQPASVQRPQITTPQEAIAFLQSRGIRLLGKGGWIFHEQTSPEGAFDLMICDSDEELLELARTTARKTGGTA